MTRKTGAIAEPAEPIDEVDEPDEGDTLARFAQLAQEISQAGRSRAKRTAKLDEVLKLAASLSDDEKAELGKMPAIRALVDSALEADRPARAGDPPGTVRGMLKKYWTEADLRTMPLERIMSPIKVSLIWNGLRRDIPAMEDVVVPEVFAGLLRDHLRNLKISEQHAAYLFQHRTNAPDDRTVLGPSTATVRATGQAGEKMHFQPGGGLIAGIVVSNAVEAEGDDAA